ncbi:NAD(P)H-quinone oxidoreductase [Thalassotalea sp. ND16A]|uniref:NAD(P)H-quinone oxidoreductase n=1 Tax=Thalassotalea sp. ND16A TaxID=1535422 RepID=UPI00051A4CA8|nr:NAD(P)H-quinone oxidoreductase [Thalassotalea sp. ND16A]KGJ99698.1 NADPH:quinone reductase [Thalassotalea sp. ND16A]
MKYIEVNAQQELVFNETDIPEIADDECLLKVKSFGVNRADLLQRAGKYPAPPGESPILGLEVCGDIVKTGDQVNSFSTKERVFGLVAGGGYAQYVKIKAAHMMTLPDELSYAQGAAIAEVYLTAYQSLFSIAKLQTTDHILIHGGASGVGTAAIQLAKAIGAKVTVTISNDRKAQACKTLGADNIINYRQQDFVAWKKQHLKSGFNVILDIVGGDNVQKNIDAVALDGRIVMLAMLGGRFCDQVDVAKMLFKRVNIHASTLRNRSDDYKTQLVADFTKQFSAAVKGQQINAVIEQEFDWQQADQAHQLMTSNSNIGKYILTIPDI